MAARLPVKPIKHSLTTALRQAVSKLETQRHRLAKRTRPPAGRPPCGIVGVGHFFNSAYLPALNRKDSPLVVSGILTRGQNQFHHARQGLRYSTTHFAGYVLSSHPALNPFSSYCPTTYLEVHNCHWLASAKHFVNTFQNRLKKKDAVNQTNLD
jgi:hypothetical protein